MDPFAILRGGARFKNGSRPGSGMASASSAASDLAASSLDFFGDKQREDEANKASNASKKSKRRRIERRGTGSAAAEDEEAAPTRTVEEVQLFRKKLRVHLKGDDVPDPIFAFADLAGSLPAKVLEGMVTAKWTNPTPIQHQAIPIMLRKRHLLAIAPTGSGKTLAFAIPIIATLGKPMAEGFRAVVISPTRELAQQIYRVMDRLATPIKLRVRLLDKSTNTANNFGKNSSMRFDVLIATPLRLVHGLSKESLSLSKVEWLVLDEADRLFENGFDEQVDEVIAACTKPTRSIALFSATMPQRVEELARTVLLDPIRIRIGDANAATTDVEQKLMYVGNEMGKLLAMRQLIQEGIKPPILVFVQSKGRAKELFHELVYDGINVDVIHADRSKEQRDEVVRQFRSGKVWVLICTDLMARGLDFKGVNVVINYDFPGNSVDYIHRVGRTGRAGRTGKAITFFTDSDGGSLKAIANVMKSSGCDVPDWMFSLKSRRKKGKSRVIEREAIDTSLNKIEHKSRKGKGKRKAA